MFLENLIVCTGTNNMGISNKIQGLERLHFLRENLIMKFASDVQRQLLILFTNNFE
jgi:hypothetical protein